MKVLNVNKFYFKKGGSETYFFGLSELLSARGHTVIPFAMQSERNLPSEYSGHFVSNVDFKGSIKNKARYAANTIYSFEAARKIEKVINSEKPDIAHLNVFQHQISPSILPVLKKYGIPIVYTLHDLKLLCPTYKMLNRLGVCEKCKGGRFYNCIRYRCTKNSIPGSLVNAVEMYLHGLTGIYSNVDSFIVPSRFYGEKLLEYGYDKDKIEYIPNFIDVKDIIPSYGSQDYFIFLGRLSEEKGILTLIRSMKSVKGSSLYILGDGPLNESVQGLIREYRLENVRVLGFREGKELKELIAGCKFTVIPSEWYENAPYSVLEAYAHGKPVIGAAIGGIPELVEEGETGYLFRSGDCTSLAEKINHALAHGHKLEAMGKKARAFAEEKFDPEKHYNSIAGVYGRLIKNSVADF